MKLGDWLFGRHLATREEEKNKVGVLAGIPMLGLDALSSAAYGPEAALTLLLVLGTAGVQYIGPITGLIVILLLIVYFSYRQTIAAYPGGGGSYTVAKENLGVAPGLLAAAALMLDYVLTVAVGIAAGVGALISAIPALQKLTLPPPLQEINLTLPLCLAILVLITLVNLRGVKESGLAFMVPTYLFVVSLLAVLAIGVVKTLLAADWHPTRAADLPVTPAATDTLSLWILMRSFSCGCTAMTGVEAVSNGVNAFRAPAVRHARRTLAAIIALLAVMLLGIAFLCRAYDISATNPNAANYDSVLSQLVAAVIGKNVFYYITIASVLAVLALSANTGFADFPRLCRVIAQDDFLPHGFAHRGRRLVYSQGIVVLAILSGLLLVVFGGITDNLIPLYAVGAFLAFTMSQAGMVAHWRRVGGPHAVRSMLINGLGAVATGVTLVVVLVSKFIDGAWISLLVILLLLIVFYAVRRHYRAVAREAACDEPLDAKDLKPPLVLLLVRGWSVITRKALRFAIKISPDVYALHIAEDLSMVPELQQRWERLVETPTREAGVPPPQLVVISSPYRRLYGPLMDLIADLEKAHADRQIAVVVPELVERRWYHFLMHNQTAAFLKGWLYFSGLRRVVVVNVPWYLAC
jgi:amino acid transporter